MAVFHLTFVESFHSYHLSNVKQRTNDVREQYV